MLKSYLHLLLGACATLAAGALHSSAASTAPAPEPVLAELFTSQGCSSCPPADQIWADLQKRQDLVAISFNIDYWDYIGWKDTLAHRENTLRQQAYAKAMGSRQVYTPQVIIDGKSDAVGNERKELIASLDARVAQTRGKRLPIRLSQSGNIVQIHVPAGTAAEPATVWIAHTSSVRKVPITKGENSGRTMIYSNVVRDIASAGTWNGQALTLQVPVQPRDKGETTDGVAAWVQLGSHGQVLGAAQIRTAAPSNR
jgi:hypothetical protein